MARNTSTKRSKTKVKRQKARVGAYRPDSSKRDVDGMVAGIRASSDDTLLSPQLARVSIKEAARAAKRDVDAGEVAISAEGLVSSPYLAVAANRCATDLAANIRWYYQITLPLLSEIASLASRLHDAPTPVAPDNGEGPAARREERAFQAAAAARAARRSSELEDLEKLLDAYRTAQLLLAKRRESCRGIYREQAGRYVRAVLKRGGSFWARVLPWRKALTATPDQIARLHVMDPEEPKMPVDACHGLSAKGVVEHADEIVLPVEYITRAWQNAEAA